MPDFADLTADIDWGHLQFFLAVAELGSLQRAAERLGVNHSTVLRRLGQLEDELSCRLFDRLPGGYALTAAGNNLAEHLRGLSEQFDRVERHVRGLDESLEGSVRVTSSDIVVEGALMALLAQFRHRHPKVKLQLFTQYQFAGLSPSEAELAVRSADAVPDDLVARQVGHIDTLMCASRAYLERHGETLAAAQQRWVMADESLFDGKLERWMRRHFPARQVAARVDSLVGMADAVSSGLGVGFLPKPLLTARPELVPLGDPLPALRRPVWVLMHPDVQHSRRVRTLFQFLVDGLGGHPAMA